MIPLNDPLSIPYHSDINIKQAIVLHFENSENSKLMQCIRHIYIYVRDQSWTVGDA